jgi:hypothetical protein
MSKQEVEDMWATTASSSSGSSSAGGGSLEPPALTRQETRGLPAARTNAPPEFSPFADMYED